MAAVPTVVALPPPPNMQGVMTVTAKGTDSTGKPIRIEIEAKTDYNWQDWFWRLQQQVNTAATGTGAQAAIQFKDEGSNLGTTGTVSSFNVVGSDLALTRSVDAVTLTQSRPTITLSGDVSGSGTIAITTTLATVNSNIGTFASVTVNGKGLTTAAANLSGDLTTSGSVATLATVNTNVGTFTAATFNGKGLATAASNMTITGDVTGTASSASLAASVVKINGVPLGSTTATLGNLLIADGTSWVSNPTSGDVTISSTGVMTIGVNKVTNAKFRQSVGLSVVGRSASTTGNVADITATIAGQIFRFDSLGILSWSAIDLTNDGNNGFSGRLPGTFGGTGLSSYAVGDILYSASTSPTALTRLADVSVGSYLRSGGVNTAPLWSTVKIPNAAATGDLWYGSAASTISALTGNITTSKQFLTQTGSGAASAAPAWGAIASADLPTITLTGDVTGAASGGSIATTLASVVSASTNTKITYNAKGLVTAGAAAALASSDFANQGTTTTVLHGNAAGNPSWGAVALGTDVSGTLLAAQFPALTGDVTTSAGSVATTVAKIQSTTVSGTTGTTNVVFSNSPTLSNSPTVNSAGGRTTLNGTSDSVSPLLVSRNSASVTSLDSGLGIFNAASDAGSAGFQFASWGGNTNFCQAYMAGGTAATPTATPAGSNMMLLSALGYNGSAYTGSKAVVAFQSLNAWSVTDNSTKMLLRITPAGTTALKTIVSLDGTGATVVGNLALSVVGNKLTIKEGTNASLGTATLVAGTVTVNNTLVTANTRIFVSVDNPGIVANLGSVYEDNTVRVAGTSFTINSTNILSTATISWLLIEPT